MALSRKRPKLLPGDFAILGAIAAGYSTSKEIAAALGLPQDRVSVRLNRIRDDKKLIESQPPEEREMGRPYLRWRLRKS